MYRNYYPSPVTRQGPCNKGGMAVKPAVWPAARVMVHTPMGVHRTCGGPDEIKEMTPTLLFWWPPGLFERYGRALTGKWDSSNAEGLLR